MARFMNLLKGLTFTAREIPRLPKIRICICRDGEGEECRCIE